MVSGILTEKNEILIFNQHNKKYTFKHLINTTGYQSLLPIERLPLDMEVTYQPCLALVYVDTQKPKTKKPFSFIVMDGAFPCVMPYLDGEDDVSSDVPRKYILTHGTWTIIGSYKSVDEARYYLQQVNEKLVQERIKPNCEAEIDRFWPTFTSRFRYLKWVGNVLVKIKTSKEFRSAITFQSEKTRMIYVIPGKISNVFDAQDEIQALINPKSSKDILNIQSYRCVSGGSLHQASLEIKEKPQKTTDTTNLQPYADYFSKKLTVNCPVHYQKKFNFSESSSDSFSFFSNKSMEINKTKKPGTSLILNTKACHTNSLRSKL